MAELEYELLPSLTVKLLTRCNSRKGRLPCERECDMPHFRAGSQGRDEKQMNATVLISIALILKTKKQLFLKKNVDWEHALSSGRSYKPLTVSAVSSASAQSYLTQHVKWTLANRKIISRKIREIGRCCSSRRKKKIHWSLFGLLIKCVRYFFRRATE